MLSLAGLLLDAAISFVCAWLVLAPLGRHLRPAWSKAMLLVPFAKVVVDLARRVGADAFLRSPRAGTRPDLGRFQLGVGFDRAYLPIFDGTLGARVGYHWYSMSLGDLLVNGIARRIGAGIVAAVAFVVVAISLARVLRRVVGAIVFGHRRRLERRTARRLGVRLVGRRRVDVYLASSGTIPFTGGLFSPYICFPVAAYEALSETEREAAIAHELAHVRAFDATLFLLVETFAELLWFVPGKARVVASMRAYAEHAADAAAVRAGVEGVVLGAALVKACAVPSHDHGFAHAPLVGERTLRARVLALLSPPKPASRAVRVSLAVLSVLALHLALFSTFLSHR